MFVDDCCDQLKLLDSTTAVICEMGDDLFHLPDKIHFRVTIWHKLRLNRGAEKYHLQISLELKDKSIIFAHNDKQYHH